MGKSNGILLFLKGMAMGAADVVPGVSGGTIAFITGIYEELLSTISALKPSALRVWKNEGFGAFWKAINGNFLLVLLSGIVVSILSLSKVIHYLLLHQPIAVWSFFFGLIVASIYYIGKQIPKRNFEAFMGLIIGALFVLMVSMMPPLSTSDNFAYLFISGFLASTAMILPGISGSFILLILGSYSVIIGALSGITTDPSQSLKVLLPAILGVVTGLMVSARAMYYLLNKYQNFIMALLTGFLIGSLYKVWPWKETELIYDKETQLPTNFFRYSQGDYQSATAYLQQYPDQAENIKVLTERNISPNCYEYLNLNTPAEILTAIGASILGFSLIFIIEKIAQKKHV